MSNLSCNNPAQERSKVLLVCTLICIIVGVIVYNVTIAKTTVDVVGLQAEVKALKRSLSQLTDMLHDLKDASQPLEAGLRILQRRHNMSDVAFMAALSATIQNSTAGSVVVFDRVYTNKGDAYNSTRGVFTAPINGTYYFSVVASTPNTVPKGQLHLFVMKGEVQISSMFLDYSTSHWLRRNTDCTMYLVHGEEVWVKINYVYQTMLAGGGFYTQFSGFLVHAD